METKGKVVKTKGISVIWLVPILALALAGWLIYKDYQSKGLLVDITFQSADGLVPGKTKVKLKDVDIGVVEDIDLTDNLEGVIVQARLDQSVKKHIHKNTQFWVERARIDTSGVSGLGTILSGAYISMYTEVGDKGSEYISDFTGLETPPLKNDGSGGVKIKLIAKQMEGLTEGAPIYYRSVKVGAVERAELSLATNMINIDAYVFSPFDKLIDTNTKFWRLPGFEANVSAEGVNFKLNSLQSLITGAISFESTRKNIDGDRKLQEFYVLHDSFEDTRKTRTFQKQYFVLYFDQNIRGLNVGATVDFKGVPIGQVISIDAQQNDDSIVIFPVEIEIEPERVGGTYHEDPFSDKAREEFQTLIDRGLRASLGTGNIITGQKLITMDVFPNEPTAELVYHDDKPVLPTKEGGVKEITTNINNLLQKVNNLDFQSWNEKVDSILVNVVEVLSNINSISSQSGKNINETFAEVRQTFDNLNQSISNANLMIDSFSEGSATRYELEQTLKSVKDAAEAIKSLANTIDEKPNAVIFGKE